VCARTTTRARGERAHSARGKRRRSGLAWQRGVLGTPILAGSIGHVECRITNGYDGGDHTIYVGEIEAADSNEGAPLLHFRHAYHRADRA